MVWVAVDVLVLAGVPTSCMGRDEAMDLHILHGTFVVWNSRVPACFANDGGGIRFDWISDQQPSAHFPGPGAGLAPATESMKAAHTAPTRTRAIVVVEQRRSRRVNETVQRASGRLGVSPRSLDL
jgi:hypothetical protein